MCCDEECHEQIGSGFGPMKESAQQIEFLLSDGSLCHISFCNACAKSLRPTDYEAVMNRAILSWEEEIDDPWRVRRGLPPWTEDQKQIYRQHYYSLWIVGRMWARRTRSFHDVPELVRDA